jgi:hypothetical protein
MGSWSGVVNGVSAEVPSVVDGEGSADGSVAAGLRGLMEGVSCAEL